jgi:hypothetical protein
MSALGNLLLSAMLLCAIVGVVWLMTLLSPYRRRAARRTDWAKLIAGVLATALGIRTLMTGHIGHWLYSPEMSASDGRARVAAVLLLVMGLIVLRSWLNDRRKVGDSHEDIGDDAT